MLQLIYHDYFYIIKYSIFVTDAEAIKGLSSASFLGSTTLSMTTEKTRHLAWSHKHRTLLCWELVERHE